MPSPFKNPYINGICAEIYIIILVSVMNLLKAPNTPDTPFDAIAALSLFVLSAAIMGYLFVGQSLLLYLNGERTQAVSFFAKTVGAFAVITVLAVMVLKVLR